MSDHELARDGVAYHDGQAGNKTQVVPYDELAVPFRIHRIALGMQAEHIGPMHVILFLQEYKKPLPYYYSAPQRFIEAIERSREAVPDSEFLRNITRLDYNKTRGWWVRIKRGEKVNKLFSDGVHGGSEPALTAAMKWRDETLLALPAPAEHRAEMSTKKNPLGFPGVYIRYDEGIAQLHSSVFKNGKRSSRTRSIKRWGIRRACWDIARHQAGLRRWSNDELLEAFGKMFVAVSEHLPEYKEKESTEPS